MSLKKLMIWRSEAVRYLTSLRSLAFKRLPKLESLPASLQHLTNLQDLYIIDCPNLMILPEWISKLTSLETLGIENCPLLAKRCEKGIGDEDWSKIAHIPNINHTCEYIMFSKVHPLISISSGAIKGKKIKFLESYFLGFVDFQTNKILGFFFFWFSNIFNLGI